MAYNILHITVHLGGGIGTVLSDWVLKDTVNDHTVVCLSHNYYKKYPELNILENMINRLEYVDNLVKVVDFVVIHFWNHPLLFQYLLRGMPKSRVCMWSHVSGFNAPYIFSKKLISYTDKFVLSSPVSYATKEIKNASTEVCTIWTTGDLSPYLAIEKKFHEGINIGYIGTLDYCKLHPMFVDMCCNVVRESIQPINFTIIGDGYDAENIKNDVKLSGMGNHFTFTGVVDDIKPYLAEMDIFGYPLNRDHFGTCEQVLGEAMAAGVQPITLNNPSEDYILGGFKDFICIDEWDYIKKLTNVYKHNLIDPKILQSRAKDLYSISSMMHQWNMLFKELSSKEKTVKVWNGYNGDNGYKIFLESLGDLGDTFDSWWYTQKKKSLQWRSHSKGSPIQYAEAFPNDKQLDQLRKLCND